MSVDKNGLKISPLNTFLVLYIYKLNSYREQNKMKIVLDNPECTIHFLLQIIAEALDYCKRKLSEHESQLLGVSYKINDHTF